MEELSVFIDKEEINKLFEEEKYKNCMDKKYFEYIVSNGKIEYIDKYSEDSKKKKTIENMVFKNKVVKVIDRLIIKSENNRWVGELENSGICDIEVSSEIEEKYDKKSWEKGLFALITLEENTDKKYPYYIEKMEILEDTNINLDEYRKNFSKRVRKYRQQVQGQMSSDNDEMQNFDCISEIDLVLNTVGISTKELTFWEKILFLVRLIPLCEANYNLMELGGNGIGKTKTYSMFSPECEIVQEMIVTEIICNKSSNEKGLLATKDVIVFDEVNKIKIDSNNEKIIPQLLNFMADGQTTSPRRIESKTSLVFSGNVMGIQERIEKNKKNIFDDSHKFEDNAFLDRIHFFLPAWGLRRYSKNVHGLGISKDVFRFDYFSKALSLLRKEDYSILLDERGYVIYNGSEREIRAIRKTVSGLIKLTHPDKKIDNSTIEAYIAIAIKGRGLINRFLNNKNKNNVSQISIEVIKGIPTNIQYSGGYPISVNESLKNLIYKNHYDKLEFYFNQYKKAIYFIFNVSYYNFFNSNTYSEFHYNLNLKIFENNIFYFGKFYPNRHIVVFNNKENQGKIVFLKFALDKMGILKNRREENFIKKNYSEGKNISLLNEGKILIFEDYGSLNEENQNYNSEIYLKVLYNKKELNYDELFGDQSLDENDFTAKSAIAGTRKIEADFSNIYPIDENKKLKCEDCNEEVTPKYMHNTITNNYHYECNNVPEGDPPYKSSPMNYVEFKYFLRENGVIKF